MAGLPGEAGPAVRAVRERVTVAAIRRIGHVGTAVVADGQVGQDPHSRLAHVLARADLEVAEPRGREEPVVERVDPRGRRGFVAYTGQEQQQVGPVALDFESDAIAIVEHPAGKVVFAGEPVDEGPQCYIVVGAFGDPANVTKMTARLQALNYTVEELQGRRLTKVAVRTSCERGNLKKVLSELRSSVNPEAWIY